MTFQHALLWVSILITLSYQGNYQKLDIIFFDLATCFYPDMSDNTKKAEARLKNTFLSFDEFAVKVAFCWKLLSRKRSEILSLKLKFLL